MKPEGDTLEARFACRLARMVHIGSHMRGRTSSVKTTEAMDARDKISLPIVEHRMNGVDHHRVAVHLEPRVRERNTKGGNHGRNVDNEEARSMTKPLLAYTVPERGRVGTTAISKGTRKEEQRESGSMDSNTSSGEDASIGHGRVVQHLSDSHDRRREEEGDKVQRQTQAGRLSRVTVGCSIDREPG